MDPEELKRLFDQLRIASSEPETVARLCEKYLSERTPTYELNLSDVVIDTAYKIGKSLKDKDFGSALLQELKEGLVNMLYERGHRENILTRQEHVLIGSSDGNKIYPYVVDAVLKNELTVEEVRKSRKLEYLKSAVGSRWGVKSFTCMMILPEIDDKGATLHDPILVDENEKTLAEKLVSDASYRRD